MAKLQAKPTPTTIMLLIDVQLPDLPILATQSKDKVTKKVTFKPFEYCILEPKK